MMVLVKLICRTMNEIMICSLRLFLDEKFEKKKKEGVRLFNIQNLIDRFFNLVDLDFCCLNEYS